MYAGHGAAMRVCWLVHMSLSIPIQANKLRTINKVSCVQRLFLLQYGKLMLAHSGAFQLVFRWLVAASRGGIYAGTDIERAGSDGAQ